MGAITGHVPGLTLCGGASIITPTDPVICLYLPQTYCHWVQRDGSGRGRGDATSVNYLFKNGLGSQVIVFIL